MNLKLYKHKYHDGIYLARNWNYCGGSEDTEFWRDTIQAEVERMTGA